MITPEEILKLAKLAKLNVQEEELPGLTADMAQIIDFADTIGAAGTGEDVEFDGISGLSNVFREDAVHPSSPVQEILLNADGGEDGYFVVRKRVQ